MRILMIFVDGVGVGQDDPDRNPLARFRPPTLEKLLSPVGPAERGRPPESPPGVALSIDANLDVDGLPQSGTGQASLFTGINCAEIAGRHFGPFPHSSSRGVLRTHNVFGRVNGRSSGSSAFANAYPPRFFAVMRQRDRWTVTTRSCLDAGIPIRTLEDLSAGKAVAADITGERLFEAGFDASPVAEETAATNLVRLAKDHRLTVFEYFMTDKAGHSRSFEQARVVLSSLDRFLSAVLDGILSRGITLLLTSDHGNLEDLSVKTHTRNPVPLVAVGPAAPYFAAVSSILDVTPAILEALGT